MLTGGGTGGHIYPALSVARCLREEDSVLYVGTADGPEARIVPQHGLEFRSVASRKLSRRPTPGAVVALAVSGYGVAQAAALLRAWKPDVVLGTGGFASAGVMFAAALLRVPTVLHEANAMPGRVNRLLGSLCTRAALTYTASARYFPAEKLVMTGLPVRPGLRSASAAEAYRTFGLDPDHPVLLVSGGSGGAQSINRAVAAALPGLGRLNLQLVHQTGRGKLEEMISTLDDCPSWYRPVEYIDDLPAVMAASTLILCRAGSSTLAEVTTMGLPALVVPYPFAVADHQTSNARALAEAGAGVCIPDAELSGERLVREVESLLGDPERQRRMRADSLAMGQPDAAQRVADLLRDVARGAGRTVTRTSSPSTAERRQEQR